MQPVILHKLQELEAQHNIRILFSCESGSRGWQFPSPDSDYDVRFIYARPFSAYLSIQERRDDLRFAIVDDLDIYGWDIRKVLKLVRKSNTTPFEWLQSPIIYRQENRFRDGLWDLCTLYFDAKSNIHHYLGIAKGALSTMESNDTIQIKKLFYVLRPLLSAQWCLERKSIAPMTIGPLMELLPEKLQAEVGDLIQLKAGAPESFVINVSATLKSYIHNTFSRIDYASQSLEKRSLGVEELDDFFVQTIRRYDH